MGDVGNVRTNDETQSLELWASAEVCESLGWTRKHLKDARETQAFPEPVAVVSRGKVAIWNAAAVRAWWLEVAGEQRKRQWRRDEAVRMYRQGLIQAEIARQLGSKADTVRKWLRDAGELPNRETQSLEGGGS